VLHCIIDTHEARDFGSDDYWLFGMCDVFDAVLRTAPGQRPHLLGFCIGAALLIGRGRRT
jgi:hypothetical protein